VVRSHQITFFASDLRRPLPSISARVPLELRTAGLPELGVLEGDLVRLRVDPTEASARLTRGDILFVAIADGEVTSVSWLSQVPAWIDEAGVWLHPGPGEASVYGGGTLASRRGQGIAPALWRYVEQWASAQGLSRLISWVRADNTQSVKTTLRLGRRPTRTVRVLWMAGMARPRPLGVSRPGSPTLSLAPPPARAPARRESP
jgi:GNAT superfamily N-acetyltransferase